LEEDPIKLWQHIHGATAHFPIALIVVSFLFDTGAILFKKTQLRNAAFWTLIIAALGCIPLVLSGLAGQVGWFGLTPLLEQNEGSSVLKTFGHRNIALVGSALAIILAVWRVARKDSFKYGEFMLYFLVLVLTTMAIGYAGYLGAYVAKGY